MALDPKSLRLFTRIAELGTSAAVAEHEHIAAAAISRRMSDLESALGVELLRRSNKGVEPTAAGRSLLDLSHRLLNEIDDIQVQMRDFASGNRGHIRIVANISTITQFLPTELGSFLAENPEVQIHLEEMVSSDIVKAIANNEADIGVMIREEPRLDVECLPYREDELVLISPLNHAIARQGRKGLRLADVIEHDFVGLPSGSQLNQLFIRGAQQLGKPWKNRVKVNSYDALCLMVQAGLGIGCLPRSTAQLFAQIFQIKVVDLLEPWAKRQIVLCVRSREALSPTARLLIDRMSPNA